MYIPRRCQQCADGACHHLDAVEREVVQVKLVTTTSLDSVRKVAAALGATVTNVVTSPGSVGYVDILIEKG
jgi:hypothetical protein